MTTDFADALKAYLAAVEQALKAGNATEHTHRPALKTLLEAIGGKDIRAVNEPKQIDCGAPDFIVTRGVVPLGYVEAKDVGIDLGRAEGSEQLGRYRESLGNLVLTDYLEFRWYLDGALRLTARLPRAGRDGRIRWNADAASEVAQLLSQFIAADIPLKATPQDLATRMAGMGKLIRGLIEQTFRAEGESGELHGQFQAFRKVLIESLTPAQFADMYAQTLCYGLFAARCNAPAQGFTRQSAASALPGPIPSCANSSTPSQAPTWTSASPGRWTSWRNCWRARTWPPSWRTSAGAPAGKTRWCISTRPSWPPTTRRCARRAASTTRRSRWWATSCAAWMRC